MYFELSARALVIVDVFDTVCHRQIDLLLLNAIKINIEPAII